MPRLSVFERPLTLADALDGAFEIVKARPRTVAVAAALFLLPLQLLVFALDPRAYGGIAAVFTDPEYFDSSASTSSGSGVDPSLLLLMVGSLPLSAVAATIAKLVEGWLLAQERTVSQCLKAVGARRWGALVVAWVGVHLVETVSLVGVGLLPVVFMTFYMVTAPAIAIEGLGPFSGMRRSWRLVRRRFWRTMWVALASALVAGTVGATLPLLPVAVAAQFGFGGDTIVAGVATLATSLLTGAFVAGVAVLTYFDLRVRTEGLDLQLALADVFAADAR